MSKLFTDLFFGDNGKGSMIDWYVRLFGVKIVIRTGGGSQPGHNIETPEGLIHCCRQFGSGALIKDVKTILTKYTLINPYNISVEMYKLINCGVINPLAEMFISENCLVITPFQVLLNKVFEASRGENRHGSVGMGVGQAIHESREYPDDAIFASDLKKNGVLQVKLMRSRFRTIRQVEEIVNQNPHNEYIKSRFVALKKMDVYQFVDFYLEFALNTDVKILPDVELGKIIQAEESLVFEPTQGILLDPDFGFWPHVTKTKTTSHNARRLITELSLSGGISETGITRAYATRHGAGPFVTEETALNGRIVDKNNADHDWQGKIRFGWLDLVGLRYALAVNGGVDDLAVTCLDQLNGFLEFKVCTSYEYFGNNTVSLDRFFKWECFGQRKKIFGFKAYQKENDMADLTKLLFECKPWDMVTFPGWKGKISKDLPGEARNYLDFLSSKQGLNIPVRYVSIGPTWQDKIEL